MTKSVVRHRLAVSRSTDRQSAPTPQTVAVTYLTKRYYVQPRLRPASSSIPATLVISHRLNFTGRPWVFEHNLQK